MQPGSVQDCDLETMKGRCQLLERETGVLK